MTTCVGGYPPAWELCTLWCVCVPWGLFLIRLVVVPTANSSPAALKHNAAWLDKLLFACRLSLSHTDTQLVCVCSCEYYPVNTLHRIRRTASISTPSWRLLTEALMFAMCCRVKSLNFRRFQVSFYPCTTFCFSASCWLSTWRCCTSLFPIFWE